MATAAPKIPMATPAALTTAFVGAAPLPEETADAVPVGVEVKPVTEVVPAAVDLPVDLPVLELVAVVAPVTPLSLLTTELAIAISSLKTLL